MPELLIDPDPHGPVSKTSNKGKTVKDILQVL